jgi:hypothetical protein
MAERTMNRMGIYVYQPGDRPRLLFVDRAANSEEMRYSPTDDEIFDLCMAYDLDYEKFLRVLDESTKPGVHTVMIDVEEYKAAQNT